MSIKSAQDSIPRGAGTTRRRCVGSASEVSWKHFRSLASQEQLAATKEEEEAFGKLPKGERDRLIRVAPKIHTNTGHRNVEALAKQLRKLGAPLTSRAAMEKVHCDSCKETGRNPPSPVASLNSESRPWKTLGIDLKDHVDKTHRSKYLIMVDEAMRLVRAKKTLPDTSVAASECHDKRGHGWTP